MLCYKIRITNNNDIRLLLEVSDNIMKRTLQKNKMFFYWPFAWSGLLVIVSKQVSFKKKSHSKSLKSRESGVVTGRHRWKRERVWKRNGRKSLLCLSVCTFPNCANKLLDNTLAFLDFLCWIGMCWSCDHWMCSDHFEQDDCCLPKRRNQGKAKEKRFISL